MSIAFVVLKLEGGGHIDPLPGVTGSRNSPGGIGLNKCTGVYGVTMGFLRVVYKTQLHIYLADSLVRELRFRSV